MAENRNRCIRGHAATLHLAASVPNLYIVESVRRHYADEYTGLVSRAAQPADGWFGLAPGPGLGVELTEQTLARPDIRISRVG